MRASIVTSATLGIAFSSACLGETINFSSASATYDQGAPYDISKAIDGSMNNGQGWAVFNGQFTDQTAIFTASAPFSASTLAIGMPQYFGGDHHVQKFRLSITTDAVPTLEGTWNSLTPSAVLISGGPTATVDAANTIEAVGSASPLAGYKILADGTFANITGVRLETFISDYDPNDAQAATLGRSPNGNFVLTEFTLQTNDTINFALGMAATSNAPTWPGLPALNLVDGLTNTLTHPGQDQQNGFHYDVDLGGLIDLSRIEIVNREDVAPERLSKYRVQVLDANGNPVWSGDIRSDGTNSGLSGVDTIMMEDGTGTFEGRFVRIENISGDQYNPQASEVRAFGAPVPEPGAGLLGGLGLAALLSLRRRK